MSSTKSSPRISECETASQIQPSSTSGSASSVSTASSIKTAQLPPISSVSTDGSLNVTTSASGATGSTSATSTSTNSSAFSIIGKKLTQLIQSVYAGKPASKHRRSRRSGGKRFTQKKYIIRKRIQITGAESPAPPSTSESTSSLSTKRDIQKWVFSCKGCSRPITRDDVRADNAIFAMDEVWHRSHLVCIKCSVNIGDEYRPFIASGPNEKHALCLDCHMEAEHPTCSACKLPLFETCVEFDEKRMHQNCFVCEKCKSPFEDGKYALIKGKPYDLDCYYFKAYEHAFSAQISGTYFDLQATSPPPIATASDSSTSLSTTTTPPTILEDQTYFKRKTAEFVSLCDVGHPLPPPEKRKELSAEIFETDNVKFPLKPPPTSAEPVYSPTLDSKEKVVTPPSTAVAAVGVRSPVAKEKLEDFVNGHEEASKKDKSNEKLIAPGNGEKKKEVDSTKAVEKNAPTEPSTPHPDSYAAAAAPDRHSAVAGNDKPDNVEKKKEIDPIKVEEKKEDKSNTASTEPSTPHPDTYAAAAALPPHPDVAETVDGKTKTTSAEATSAQSPAIDSKEKVPTSPVFVRSPIVKEKLEDFVNGHEEVSKKETTEEKLTSPGNNEKKKEIDPPKVEEKKEDKSNTAPTEPSNPHPDTYAAAAALTPHPPTVAGTDATTTTDQTKMEPKKDEENKEESDKIPVKDENEAKMSAPNEVKVVEEKKE